MPRRATMSAIVALIAAFTQIPSHAQKPEERRAQQLDAAREPRRPYVPARPEAMGEWPSMISLAGSWKYHAGPRVPAEAHRPDHDESDWSEIQVPSNWYLQGVDRSGSIWFRRTFRVPRGQAGKRTRLVFDGVDYGAEVWLNGRSLGTHQGYFERFSFVAGPWLYEERGHPHLYRLDVQMIDRRGAIVDSVSRVFGFRTIAFDVDLWPGDDAGWEKWKYHDFQPHETFTLAKVPRGASVTVLIANTQRYQAELVQFAAESYRRQKHAPIGAIFQFMFNECWPSANWGIVDYWRRPKPGYAALVRAYQPVLPSIAWTPEEKLTSAKPVTAAVWIVNDF
jgi:beta-galactosidase/beta-glucuronidase